MRTMRIAGQIKGWGQAVAAVMLVSVLVACGGGGGSSNNSSTTLNGGSLPASPTQTPIAANAANTTTITVGAGTSGVANIPTVSVTICAPGTASCQTIPNIQLDTASFGLRLVSGAINQTFLSSLPVNTVKNGTAQLAECASFADGYTWGSVRNVGVTIGSETTSTAIPVQIIGDMSAASVPSSCGGTAENTVSDLGANGILGVGTAPVDCGTTCSNSQTAANYSIYYACPNGASCTRTAVPTAQQVANPVANFPVDNNGVIVQLPAVPTTGSPSATGTLVFGIGTQGNNTLAAAQSYTTDAYGNLNNSVFNGTTVQAFLDSGSNAYFFTDNSISQCGGNLQGFYCPSSAQTRSVTLGGQNSARVTASVGVLNASTLFNTGNYAFNDLGGQLGGNNSFDLGLPFFFGRYVYYGFDKTATGGQAPYVAF